MPRLPALISIAFGSLLAGCFRSPPEPRPPVDPTSITADGLHNVFRLTDDLYSGSSPDGDVGFRSLHDLGVRTIITVDGATPEWRTAAKFGMRYVHLPIGYDGIPDRTGRRIARAVRDLPGPVYVHCHHGRHRGPAAAACALLALDSSFSPEQADEWLTVAGTNPKYRGLIELPHTFRRPTRAELDAIPADFPKTAKVPGLTRLMVDVDERWDALKLARDSGWKSPADHPDIDPPHEAVQLAELFREAVRLPESEAKGVEFLAQMRAADAAAGDLKRAVRESPARSEAAFLRCQTLCSQCHTNWRD